MLNKYQIKIGQIEITLEGDAEFISQEREIFFGQILPQVTDTIKRTQSIEHFEKATLSVEEISPQNLNDKNSLTLTIKEFLLEKGNCNQWETALFLMYYAEHFQSTESFSSDDITRLFKQARLTNPSNTSMIIFTCVNKGYLTEADNDNGSIKKYIITKTGLDYVENYKPKTKKITELSSKTKKSKSRTIIESKYKSLDITVDDLNISNYISINSLKNFLDKMILAMYIFTNEKKGDSFSTKDIMYILTDIFGENATKNQVEGVFKRNKTWFKKFENVDTKLTERKLLNLGISHAKALIQK